MELEHYLAIARRWLWLIVACVLVAGVSSYLSTRSMPRIYQASTTVIIGQTLQEPNPTGQDFWTGEQLAQTYANMVRRQPILQGVAQALGLSYIPSAENVSARSVPGTQLLEISVRDTDPERARVIADEIAHQLILQSPTESPDEQQRWTFVQSQLQDLEAKIEGTKKEIEGEQAKLDAANSARAIQQYQNNIAALQQKLTTYQSTYASLLTTVQGGVNYISVVEPAVTPTGPISPRVGYIVTLASAIGLILAVSGALLIEYLDDTIKTPDDVTQTINLPTLGAVTRIEGASIEDKLVAADHPRSPVSEAYRSLRTNLQFSAVDKPLKTLLVTSANPIEGKSLTVANLGVVMAQAGHSVVLIDADLRRPTLHRIFGLTKEEGLTNALLQGNPSPDGYLQATKVENLRVLTSGPLPPNPSELLSSERMRKLIEHLKGQADVLLFDSPPSLAVTDAAVLSSQVDGVLLVVDAGACRRDLAARAVEGLSKVGGNVLGAVLNKLSPRGSGYYYYYYYYSQDGDKTKRRKHRSWKSRLSKRIPLLKRFLG